MTTPSESDRFLDVPLHFEAVLPGPALRVDALLALSEGSGGSAGDLGLVVTVGDGAAGDADADRAQPEALRRDARG